MKEQGFGLLGPNEEGPYHIQVVLRPSTYELETIGGTICETPDKLLNYEPRLCEFRGIILCNVITIYKEN